MPLPVTPHLADAVFVHLIYSLEYIIYSKTFNKNLKNIRILNHH